jgi:hypothetical protein
VFVHALGDISGKENAPARSRSWMDEWLLGRAVAQTLQAWGMDEFNANQAVTLVKVATVHQELMAGSETETADTLLNTLLQDADVQRLLRVNRWQDVLWFDKEGFEYLLRWLTIIQGIVGSSSQSVSKKASDARKQTIAQLQKAVEASGYQIEKLRAAAKPKSSKRKTTTSEMRVVRK